MSRRIWFDLEGNIYAEYLTQQKAVLCIIHIQDDIIHSTTFYRDNIKGLLQANVNNELGLREQHTNPEGVLLEVQVYKVDAQINIGQSSFCSQVDFTTSGLVAQILDEVNATVTFATNTIHIFGNGTSFISNTPVSPLIITNNHAQCTLQWQDIRDVFHNCLYANSENATIGFAGTIVTSTCNLQVGYMGINGMSSSSINENLYLCSISGNQTPDKRAIQSVSKEYTIVQHTKGNTIITIGNQLFKDVGLIDDEKEDNAIQSAKKHKKSHVEIVDKRADTSNLCQAPDSRGERQCYCYNPSTGMSTFVRLVCSYRSNHPINENNRIAAINYVNTQYKAGNSKYDPYGSYVSTGNMFASSQPSSNDGLFSTLFLGSNFRYKPPTTAESNCCNAIMIRFCAPNSNGQTSYFNECSPQSPTSQWDYIMGPQYI